MYANEMTDDVIHSTQHSAKHILNRPILASLLETWLTVRQETHLYGDKFIFPWQLPLFQSLPT